MMRKSDFWPTFEKLMEMASGKMTFKILSMNF